MPGLNPRPVCVKFVVEISGAKKDLYPTTSDFLIRILPMPHTHYFVYH